MKLGKRWRLVALVALAVVVGLSSPSAPADPTVSSSGADGGYVPREILVKPRDGASRRSVSRVADRIGARPVKAFPEIGVELWRIRGGLAVGDAIATLQSAELADVVEFAEPNWRLYAHELPDDPRFGELWGLQNLGQTGGTLDADIDAVEAWNEVTGSGQVVVAVIDSGVDYTHEDLAGNIWLNAAEPVNGIDDDSNGYVDDFRGWNFVVDSNDPMDNSVIGHGTHVAGTIGAMGDNGTGVAGVNWNITIMPLKFLDNNGTGSTDDAIEAILYAASFGVPISSNSWGGGRRSKALETAIDQAGALFVASAGNDGSSRKTYPAGYPSDNILSVAATDHDDLLAWFSNYGESWVDLAAPGVDILSTVPNDSYDLLSGTSMAAPHVAGVAGLLLAQNPGWRPVELKSQILGGVDAVPALVGLVASGGRLDAAGAVGASQPPPDTTPPAAVTDLAVDTSATTHNSVRLAWTAPGDDGDVGTAALYDVRYSTDPILDETDFAAAQQSIGEPSPQPAGSPEVFAVSGLTAETVYFFAMKSVDEAGNVSALSNAVSEMTVAQPPGAWTFEVLDTGRVGNSISLDFDTAGSLAVAYSQALPDKIWFAVWNGSGWDREEVVSRENRVIGLSYDALGVPTVVYGRGKISAAERVGTGWQTTRIDTGEESVRAAAARDPQGNLAVAYGSRRGLDLSRQIGGNWVRQTVAPEAALWVGLAYDSGGYPAIVASSAILRLARFDGASWFVETVEANSAYGAIDFPLGAQEPILMHGSARVMEWDGTQWVGQTLDPDGRGGTLVVADDGTVYAAWADPEQVKLAIRAPGATSWSTEILDSQAGAWASDVGLTLSPDQRQLYIAFRARSDEAWVGWATLP